jgi:hypothetical protein
VLRPRPVAWLAELATVLVARDPRSLTNVGSVILAQLITLVLEHVFV